MKDELTLTPELLLQAYRVGLFPMSEGQDDPEVFWVDPTMRGVFPLDGFHISRSLARRMRATQYQVTFDIGFEQVMQGCADRKETWINETIFTLYAALHAQGRAHAVAVWDGEDLVGGVYGVTIGTAFFGESMFSRRTDVSKIALAYLVDRLRISGFQLFDTQFITPHLASLGAIEISREHYHAQLDRAISQPAQFGTGPAPSAYEVIQRNAQTS